MKKLLFLLNRGFRFFYANISLNIASIITVTTILFVFQIFLVLSYSVDSFFSSVGDVQSIRLYLRTNDKNEIDSLINKINQLESISKTEYYAPADTLKSLKESTGSINYLQNIPKEFYPHYIEAKIQEEHRDIENIKNLEKTFEKYDTVDVASYGEKWIVNFSKLNYGFKLFISLLTILLTLALSTILYNTIKINLYRYKDEIKIYSLVGASRTFIITPILISVLMESVISYIMSAAAIFTSFFILNNKLLHNIGIYFIKMPNIFIFLISFTVLIFVALFSAIMSSKTFIDNMGAIGD